MSSFNYCPIVWHNGNVCNMKKVENLHKRALRIVYNDFSSSYKDLLIKSGRSMLYVNRQCLILEQVYKILHGNAPPFSPNFYAVKHCNYNLRNSYVLKQSAYNTVTYGFNSFTYQS